MISPSVHSKPSDPRFRRNESSETGSILEDHVISPDSDFAEFFRHFVGPVGSEVTGYLLLDLVEDEPSILSATRQLREKLPLPEHFLVISDLLGNGLLLYDLSTEAVFDVDFEEGFELLLEGKLGPRWDTFSHFLSEFFDV